MSNLEAVSHKNICISIHNLLCGLFEYPLTFPMTGGSFQSLLCCLFMGPIILNNLSLYEDYIRPPVINFGDAIPVIPFFTIFFLYE